MTSVVGALVGYVLGFVLALAGALGLARFERVAAA